jgi:hypothetical protein
MSDTRENVVHKDSKVSRDSPDQLAHKDLTLQFLDHKGLKVSKVIPGIKVRKVIQEQTLPYRDPKEIPEQMVLMDLVYISMGMKILPLSLGLLPIR